MTIEEVFNNFNKCNIVVIGDYMLDRYIYGKINRISPEASVPIVDVYEKIDQLGGAANVVNNIKALKANAIPIGVVGADLEGEIIAHKLLGHNYRLSYDGLIIKDPDISTTVKTRLIAHNDHVIRFDSESRVGIGYHQHSNIMNMLHDLILKSKIDAIVLEDYNKGVLTRTLISDIIAIANRNNVLTFVDPKQKNIKNYKHCTVFKPNKKELLDMYPEYDESKFLDICDLAIDEMKCEYMVVTLSEDGILLVDKNLNKKYLTTKAKNIADVTGAGDSIIATLAVAYVSGATIEQACIIANHAAGIVCSKVGTVAVDMYELKNDVLNNENVD